MTSENRKGVGYQNYLKFLRLNFSFLESDWVTFNNKNIICNLIFSVGICHSF